MRSDVYQLADDGTLAGCVDRVPLVDLDHHYSRIAGFDARFPTGPPSLRQARSLTVRGDWTFGSGVVVRGDAVLDGEGGRVDDGTRLGD
jgi:UTP--glucose-1-phosphate uridylyltransferase